MLIDTHCHLPSDKYTKPLEEIIRSAELAGVGKLINIGTSLEENLKTLEVSNKYTYVYSTVAIYPHEDIGIELEELRKGLENQLTLSKKIVAIGECGLDVSDWEGGRALKEQVGLFEMQLELASKNNLPVVIHNRGGDDIIMGILDGFISRGLTGVAHCFSSSWEIAEEFLKRGFYLSFSGMLTYKSREELREVAKKVPTDMFLFETDAPYLPPEGFRGKPNEPALVVEVAKKFAEVRGVPFDKVVDFAYSNTYKLFKGLS